jgi:bifunctional DNA-binding transcriptional regulator/antitoxin component of YhaV-PrlF toxin-antitoxin module
MVVVVLVVVAMEKERGDHIVTKEFITRLAESHANNVNNQITLEDTAVQPNQPVVVCLDRRSDGSWKRITSWTTRTYSTCARVTLPKNIVVDWDISPGEKLRAKVYEHQNESIGDKETQQPLIDNTPRLLDTVQPVKSKTAHSGYESRLYSNLVYNYLHDYKEKEIIYKNTDTGVEITRAITRNDKQNTFTFPKDIRGSFELSDDTEIEIYAVESNNSVEQKSSDELARIESELSDLNQSFDDLAEVVLQIKHAVNND